MTIASVIAREKLWHVHNDDALTTAKLLPDNCIHCIATSPPYFGLRNYGTGRWEGGDLTHTHETKGARGGRGGSGTLDKRSANAMPSDIPVSICSCGAVYVDEQIGLEETPDAYAAKLVELFCELRRALHPTGSLWLNLGDSYAGGGGGNYSDGKRNNSGQNVTNVRNRSDWLNSARVKAKDLIGIPWLVAFALRADGWYLRQWMPWVKANAMPESAADRPSTSCETIFLLTKNPDYFFDMEAVKRAVVTGSNGSSFIDPRDYVTKPNLGTGPRAEDSDSRNFRSADLWFDSRGMLLAGDLDGTDDNTILGFDVTLNSYKGAHFATWPQKLVAPMIKAGTSERGVCPHCFAPHTRIVTKSRVPTRTGAATKVTGDSLTDGNRDPERHVTTTETIGWEPSCSCPEHEPVPALVYDPFAGSGTTGKVALDLGRVFLGSELNPEYMKLIATRLRQAKPSLF